MLVPNRNYQSPEYRYGFQGQEKDDEIKGIGNSLNYKYRMHDPRIGRFFAVDPLTKKYPWYTPYSFSGNKVINSVEIEGLEERVVIGGLHTRYYNVRKGETLTKIAKITNTNLSDIIKWNISAGMIKHKDFIRTGQAIVLEDISGVEKGVYGDWYNRHQTFGDWYKNDPYTQKAIQDRETIEVLQFTANVFGIIGGAAAVQSAVNASTRYNGMASPKQFNGMPILKDFPFRTLSLKTSEFDIISNYLKQFGNRAENEIMLERMQKIEDGVLKATEQDVNFKNHELREMKLVDEGMIQTEAHIQTLKEQGMYHRNYETKLYTKEAIKAGDAQQRSETD